MHTLQAVGVGAGVVNDTRDLFQDAQLKHRGHFVFLEHPEMGVYATERSEMELSLTPGSLDRPAPLLGQHTHEALTEIIGLSEGALRVRLHRLKKRFQETFCTNEED